MKEETETASLAFLVRNLEEAKAIHDAVGGLSRTHPLLLVSQPSTAAKEGALWFLSLIEEAGWPRGSNDAHPIDALPIVDCGEHPGYALEALELDPLGIIFSGPRSVAAKLSEIAKAKTRPFYHERPELIELPTDREARTERLRLLVETLPLK